MTDRSTEAQAIEAIYQWCGSLETRYTDTNDAASLAAVSTTENIGELLGTDHGPEFDRRFLDSVTSLLDEYGYHVDRTTGKVTAR